MNEENKIPPPPPPSLIPPPPPPPPQPQSQPEVIREKEIVYVEADFTFQQPQAIELEEVVLGALLIDTRAIKEVAEILVPIVFYDDRHKLIYKAIRELHNRNEAIDLLTVSNELRRMGKLNHAGGDFYLVQLTQKVSSAAHIEHHTRIVLQKYIQRELIRVGRETVQANMKHNADVFVILDRITHDLQSIESVAIRKVGDANGDPEEEFDQKLKDAEQGILPGVMINVEEYDDWSGGMHKRELITIAARPGMGKTTVVIAITGSLSIDRDVRTSFFSLEMSKTDLSFRYAAKMTGIPYKKIRNIKELTPDEKAHVRAALKKLKERPIKIYDTTEHNNTLEKIISMIRQEVKDGSQIVFIDYVQLIELTQTRGTETADLNVITKRLKALANELNIPIVILAQLNRAVDTRPGHRPTLGDLKQSGSIEQDSDTVIFIVREAYYQQKENKVEPPPNVAGDTEWIVAKGRNIGTRDFRTMIDFKQYNFQSYFMP